jgi:hypothetical protein
MILDLFQQTETQKLVGQLSGYGLDPKDWVLRLQNDGNYFIQSKGDKDFVFEGKTKGQGHQVTWEKIDLISL